MAVITNFPYVESAFLVLLNQNRQFISIIEIKGDRYDATVKIAQALAECATDDYETKVTLHEAELSQTDHNCETEIVADFEYTNGQTETKKFLLVYGSMY